MKASFKHLKRNFWRASLPLSIISFAIISKWWYVIPVDAPDSMMNGFPLIYVSEGWHTSMSLQFFFFEFIIDFLCFLLFWMLIIYVIQRTLRLSKKLTGLVIGLWALAILVLATATFIFSRTENLFYFKRDFDVEVLDSGYQFIWQDIERPDYYHYKPSQESTD